MKRKNAREIALHLIFEMDFQEYETGEEIQQRLADGVALAGESELYAEMPDDKQMAYIQNVVKGVAAHRAELDEKIVTSAKGWSLHRISRISRAVLRLALYEMLYAEDVPVGAAINEAVALAKEYDSVEAGKFVNGILGAVGRELSQQDASATALGPADE